MFRGGGTYIGGRQVNPIGNVRSSSGRSVRPSAVSMSMSLDHRDSGLSSHLRPFYSCIMFLSPCCSNGKRGLILSISISLVVFFTFFVSSFGLFSMVLWTHIHLVLPWMMTLDSGPHPYSLCGTGA